MRNIINTLGLSIVFGAVALFYMACIEGFILDGSYLGYMIMTFLFPYAIEDQLISLGYTMATIACACTPRTYVPYTQTWTHQRYLKKQARIRTHASCTTYSVHLPSMPILRAHTRVEHVHNHSVKEI